MMSKKEETNPQPQPQPQISFVEAEIREVEDFINNVYMKAKFEVSPKEMKDFQVSLGKMANHVKKIREHILEITRVIPAKGN
jgi:hypothetical protein